MSRVRATVNLMMMSNVDRRDGEEVRISWDGRRGGWNWGSFGGFGE